MARAVRPAGSACSPPAPSPTRAPAAWARSSTAASSVPAAASPNASTSRSSAGASPASPSTRSVRAAPRTTSRSVSFALAATVPCAAGTTLTSSSAERTRGPGPVGCPASQPPGRRRSTRTWAARAGRGGSGAAASRAMRAASIRTTASAASPGLVSPGSGGAGSGNGSPSRNPKPACVGAARFGSAAAAPTRALSASASSDTRLPPSADPIASPGTGFAVPSGTAAKAVATGAPGRPSSAASSWSSASAIGVAASTPSPSERASRTASASAGSVSGAGGSPECGVPRVMMPRTASRRAAASTRAVIPAGPWATSTTRVRPVSATTRSTATPSWADSAATSPVSSSSRSAV